MTEDIRPGVRKDIEEIKKVVSSSDTGDNSISVKSLSAEQVEEHLKTIFEEVAPLTKYRRILDLRKKITVIEGELHSKITVIESEIK